MSDSEAPEKKEVGLWVKLYHAFLDDEKILAIKLLPDGYLHILVFVELLLLAGKINNFGRFTMTRSKKMTIDQIAHQLRRKSTDFANSLKILVDYDLIFFNLDNCLEIMNWDKYQNVDVSQKKKELDRVRQNRKRIKENINPKKAITDPDQRTMFEAINESCHADVTPISRECHADIAPLDKDIDKDKDTDDKTSSTKKSLSSFIFNKEKESLIKKYVEYKFLSGEILKNKRIYEKSVRENAANDSADFEGMRDYIIAFEKEDEDKKIEARKNFLILAEKQIEDAKKELEAAIATRVKSLPETDQKLIKKKALKNIRDEFPMLKKPLPGQLEKTGVKIYYNILRDSHFETAVKEQFCGPGEITGIDRLDFTIDFAIANKLSMDDARSILDEQTITVPKNYSIIYQDKDTVKEMLSVYSRFGKIKNEKIKRADIED